MENKNFKETVGKIRSLIERVEGNMTPREAELNEQMRVDEALKEGAERKFIGPNELFDALAEMRSKSRVCVGYVCGANLNYPTVKRKNPETNRMKSYNDYETFGKNLGVEGEVAGVIKLSRYFNFNYQSHDDINKQYGEFAKFEDDLRSRYDLPPIARGTGRGQYTSKQEFGEKGITDYSGKDETKLGRTYNRQNVYGAKIESKYFLIGSDGNIIKELSKGDLIDYIKPHEVNGVSVMRKLGREEEEIKQYIEDYNAGKMSFQTFINDKVLYIAAKSESFDKFTYINDRLPDEIDGVKINPSQFINMARQHYKIDQSEL